MLANYCIVKYCNAPINVNPEGGGVGIWAKSKNSSQIPEGGDMNVIQVCLIGPTQGAEKFDNKQSQRHMSRPSGCDS